MVLVDLLTRYPVAGVHLDYIRYAGWGYSHDPVSADRYKSARALRPDMTYRQWQREQVTALVKTATTLVRRYRPNAWTSAAVWPVWRNRWDWWTVGDAYSGFCQDSVGWLQDDAVNVICPMLYNRLLIEREDYFRAVVQAYAAEAPRQRVVAGLWGDVETFASLARRVDAVRAAGLGGFALFSARLVDRHGWWNELKGIS